MTKCSGKGEHLSAQTSKYSKKIVYSTLAVLATIRFFFTFIFIFANSNLDRIIIFGQQDHTIKILLKHTTFHQKP